MQNTILEFFGNNPCLFPSILLAILAIAVIFRRYAWFSVLALIVLLGILVFPNGGLLIMAGALVAVVIIMAKKNSAGITVTINNSPNSQVIIDQSRGSSEG